MQIKKHKSAPIFYNAGQRLRPFTTKAIFSLFVAPELIPTFQEKQESVIEDDWRVGVIEKYINDKDTICVKDIWDNALTSGDFPKDCTKKDSSDIVQIMDAFPDWEKVSCIRFF